LAFPWRFPGPDVQVLPLPESRQTSIDAELGEKSGARLRDFSGLVADHDVFMGD
jgi:hypothetical protein